MFNIFKKRQPNKPVSGGLIAYYGLEEWWKNELTETERKTVEEVYGTLTFGNVYSRRESCFGFVSNLLGWFHKPEYFQIINKIAKLADSMVDSESDVLTKHFYFLNKIRAYYPCRKQFPEALDMVIKACEDQISISKEAAVAFLEEEVRYLGSFPFVAI